MANNTILDLENTNICSRIKGIVVFNRPKIHVYADLHSHPIRTIYCLSHPPRRRVLLYLNSALADCYLQFVTCIFIKNKQRLKFILFKEGVYGYCYVVGTFGGVLPTWGCSVQKYVDWTIQAGQHVISTPTYRLKSQLRSYFMKTLKECFTIKIENPKCTLSECLSGTSLFHFTQCEM